MTRFFTKLDADGSYRSLKEVCEKMGYGWKRSCTNQVGMGPWRDGGLCQPPPRWLPLHCRLQVTISTTDRRNNKLIFKVNLVEMESKILVDFRLSKVGAGGGCEVGAQRARGRLQGKCKAVQGGARRVQGGCKVLHSGCKVVHGGVQCGARWVQGTEPLSLPVQGDGLEFKRHFLKIKGKLSDIVSTQKVWAPVT